MKRILLPLAVLGALLVPAAPAITVPTGTVPTAADTDGTGKIPDELCFGVLGSDFERIFCSAPGAGPV